MRKLENPIQATIGKNFDNANGAALGFSPSSLSKFGNSGIFIPYMDNSHIWETGFPCSSPTWMMLPWIGLSLNPKKSQSQRKTCFRIPDFFPSHPPSSASDDPKAFSSPGSSQLKFPVWKSWKIPDPSWENHKNSEIRGCPVDPISEVLCWDKPGILAPCQAWECFSIPKINQGMGEL